MRSRLLVLWASFQYWLHSNNLNLERHYSLDSLQRLTRSREACLNLCQQQPHIDQILVDFPTRKCLFLSFCNCFFFVSFVCLQLMSAWRRLARSGLACLYATYVSDDPRLGRSVAISSSEVSCSRGRQKAALQSSADHWGKSFHKSVKVKEYVLCAT